MKKDHAVLGDFCQIVQGGRLKLNGNDFVAQGFPAYGAGGLNGHLDVAEFDCEAVILSAIGARCGKCFHVSGHWTSLANTQIIIPDPDRADSRFLWHQLNDEKRWPRSGTGQPFIKPSDVKGHKVCLPPLEEQRRIAAILDKAAQLTEACASLQAAHRRMGESLFIEAFGEPRTNPLDLPSARLGAIADCQLGKMLDKKRQSGCSKRPYLRNANVRWFEIDTSDVLFMDIGDHEIDRFGVSQGDLLVCEGGEPGRSAIWKGGNGVIGFQKALHRVRADRHKVLPEYLNWALWMFAQRGLLSDHITSATIAHLTREKLVNINILIPPVPVQERFARQLEALNALSQSAKSRNQILRSLNSSTFSTLLGWCAGK